MDNDKPQARLEQWYVGRDDLLHGIVYDHPDFSDGSEIVTSRVVEWDPNKKHAITKHTNYILGEPRARIK